MSTTDRNPERVAREARRAWGSKAAEICRAFGVKAPTANSRAEWNAAAKILEREDRDHVFIVDTAPEPTP